MPEQPNYCTGCRKLMPDTNAAYYCSKACMDKVRGNKEIMKHLFNENENYTEEALAFHRKIAKAVKPILKAQFDEGYSIRDMENIAISAITEEISVMKLRSQVERRKKSNETF